MGSHAEWIPQFLRTKHLLLKPTQPPGTLRTCHLMRSEWADFLAKRPTLGYLAVRSFSRRRTCSHPYFHAACWYHRVWLECRTLIDHQGQSRTSQGLQRNQKLFTCIADWHNYLNRSKLHQILHMFALLASQPKISSKSPSAVPWLPGPQVYPSWRSKMNLSNSDNQVHWLARKSNLHTDLSDHIQES